MKTHDQLIKELMDRPEVNAEVDRIECEEAVLLDAILKTRCDSGFTQD